jgi:DNA-binding MarR family transcriptional regulator
VSKAIGRALHGIFYAAVRGQPRDMSLTSSMTLGTLELTGPRRVTDLAESERVTQPSMTELVRALERSGLVERRADPTDGRVTLVALTSDGAKYLRARRQATMEVFIPLISQLSADEIDALVAAIPALTRIQRLDEERRKSLHGWRAQDDG